MAPLDLPTVKSADGQHAWCMVDEDDVTLCHSVLAAEDLLSSLWVASPQGGEAKDALATSPSLAAEWIVTRIG